MRQGIPGLFMLWTKEGAAHSAAVVPPGLMCSCVPPTGFGCVAHHELAVDAQGFVTLGGQVLPGACTTVDRLAAGLRATTEPAHIHTYPTIITRAHASESQSGSLAQHGAFSQRIRVCGGVGGGRGAC